MARKIKDVLTDFELERLKSIANEISDPSQARIISNISHIVCALHENPETHEELVQARVCIDPRPFYEKVLQEKLPALLKKHKPRTPAAERDYEAMAGALLARRTGHLYEFRGRPHERKAYEAELRRQEIEANRHYLHEAEGNDPGLLAAAAHWLKEYSNVFCGLAESQYQDIGVKDFSLAGMERAVVVEAPGKEGTFLSVLVLSSDLTCEEAAAQYSTGLNRITDSEIYKSKAARIRDALAKAEEAMHLCVLGGKRTK